MLSQAISQRIQANRAAVLYYTSQYFIWWDFGGMTIQELNIGGIDPNCRRPKPRPTTPRDFFESILFQYQKGNWLVISEISEKKQ